MQFEFLYGDILEQEVEAIVVPEIADARIKCEFTAKIYEAAGYTDMDNAYAYQILSEKKRNKTKGIIVENEDDIDWAEIERINFEAGLHSRICVTSGYNLKAKYAIHIDIKEDVWRYDQDDIECVGEFLFHKDSTIYYCYKDALDCAKELGVRSVAFPLLGTCFLRFPEEHAKKIGKDAVSSWLSDPLNYLEKVYIVIPTPKASGYITSLGAGTETLVTPPYIMEYEKIFEKSIERSGSDIKEFSVKKCREYLQGIDKPSKLAKDLGFGPEVITRFKNKLDNLKNGHIPHKKRVIALAIGMGLSDYQRFEFIRCSGYDYPSEKLDIQVEEIIRSGVKKFELINKMLCDNNPDNDLSAPLKKTDKVV